MNNSLRIAAIKALAHLLYGNVSVNHSMGPDYTDEVKATIKDLREIAFPSLPSVDTSARVPSFGTTGEMEADPTIERLQAELDRIGEALGCKDGDDIVEHAHATANLSVERRERLARIRGFFAFLGHSPRDMGDSSIEELVKSAAEMLANHRSAMGQVRMMLGLRDGGDVRHRLTELLEIERAYKASAGITPR